MRQFLVALAVGAAAGAVAYWFIGVPGFWAVVIGLPVAGCAYLAALLSVVAAPSWQPEPLPGESLTVHQASSLGSRFAEAANDQQRFQHRIQPRLRALAGKALRLRDLDEPRAREALGADLHDLLTNRDARLPSPHRLAELLSRLEEK
jgi:hypothetical protein